MLHRNFVRLPTHAIFSPFYANSTPARICLLTDDKAPIIFRDDTSSVNLDDAEFFVATSSMLNSNEAIETLFYRNEICQRSTAQRPVKTRRHAVIQRKGRKLSS